MVKALAIGTAQSNMFLFLEGRISISDKRCIPIVKALGHTYITEGRNPISLRDRQGGDKSDLSANDRFVQVNENTRS